MSEEAIYKLHIYPSGELEEFEYVHELIRCKECEHWKGYCGHLYGLMNPEEDDFCSYGEREGE